MKSFREVDPRSFHLMLKVGSSGVAIFLRAHGHVPRIHHVAYPDEILHHAIDIIIGHTHDFFGTAVILFYADDDVSAAEILIIVGERADGVQYFFGIPTAFVLDPGTLYRLVQDQLLGIDR